MPIQEHLVDALSPDGGAIRDRLRAGDVYELFARLDYSILKGFEPQWFKRTIVKHLKRTRQKDFTWDTIDKKVQGLWKYNAAEYKAGQSDYTCVYRLGTKALRYFNDDAKKAIQTRVQEMVRGPVVGSTKQRQGRTRQKNAPKRTSLGVEVRTRSLRSTESAFEEARSCSTAGNLTRASGYPQVLPSPSEASRDSLSRDSCLTPCPIPNRQRMESLSPATISPTHSAFHDASEQPTQWHKTKLEGLLTSTDAFNKQSREQAPTHVFDPCGGHTSSSGVGEGEVLQQILVERERDLQYFRLEWSKAQETIKKLEQRLHYEELNRAILKRCEEPTEDTLKRYLHEIEIFRSKLNDKEALCPFTSRAGKQLIPLDEKYFQEEMANIGNMIEDFMCSAETLEMCGSINFANQSEDLHDLFVRTFGESENALQSVSFYSLLRSLVSAALCEWVFEREVQEEFLTSSQLRETMLSHIATMDGEDVARNIDFAAHYTLIESDYFQHELIPRRARALAARLYSAVSPIFGLQKPLTSWKMDPFTTWNRNRAALESVFGSALKIKTRAFVSKDIFEVILPQQGSEYDPQLMETEDLDRDNGSSTRESASRVRLCLVPGLRKYPYDRKLVDCNSFRRPDGDSWGPFDPIAKPLVITG